MFAIVEIFFSRSCISLITFYTQRVSTVSGPLVVDVCLCTCVFLFDVIHFACKIVIVSSTNQRIVLLVTCAFLYVDFVLSYFNFASFERSNVRTFEHQKYLLLML